MLSVNVSLLCLHIKDHWCPLQCNPHLPSNAIVSKYYTHTRRHSPLVHKHSLSLGNQLLIISIVCVVASGCIFLFPLKYSHFSLLIVVYAIPRRLIVVYARHCTTYSHTSCNITSSTTTSFISSNTPFDCCVLHWIRANYLVSINHQCITQSLWWEWGGHYCVIRYYIIISSI